MGLCVQGPSFAAEPSRSAKLFGEISLSPIEPVIGSLVELGEKDRCCHTLPEQETWPSTEFELDLEDRDGYRFHSIGVFVEPQDGAKDAFYALFPSSQINFEQGEARFSFEHALRPVQVRLGRSYWRDTLKIEASSRIQDLKFVSYREWDMSALSFPTTFVIWVPEGVEQELVIRTSTFDPDAGLDNFWDTTSTTRVLGKDQDSLDVWGLGTFGLNVDVELEGASSQWIQGGIRVHREDAVATRDYSFDRWSRDLRVYMNGSGVYQMQPSFLFEDGSHTTLATRELFFDAKEREHEFDIQAQLTPTQLSTTVNANFDLEELRISVAQGTGINDAAATKEVKLGAPVGPLKRREARTTLQLPEGEWQLSGLMVQRKGLLWTSNYLSWSADAEKVSSPAQELMDFGQAARLVELDLVVGPDEAQREDHHISRRSYPEGSSEWRLRGELVEPGQDARGRYVDRIYRQHPRRDLIGRAGHRYRFVTEKPSGEQVGDAFEVTFGRPQKLRPVALAFTGTSSLGKGRCNELEIMYDGVASDGPITMSMLSLPPTPPRGYLVWPEKGEANRSFDVRRNFEVEPGSTARVCVQYDEEALAQAGLSAQDLTLAHPLKHQQGDEGCDPSNVYLGERWCGMPKVEPQEMVFLLGAEEGCRWYCGLAKASTLEKVALLRQHPSQRPMEHCRDQDYYAHGDKGWAPVKAPAHLAAAYEEGVRLGRDAARRAWDSADMTKKENRDAVHRVFYDFFEEAFSREPRDPVELCALRGQARGYSGSLMDL